MEPNEKASIYRMLPCTQAPGKIVFVGNNFDGQSLSGAPVPDAGALSPISELPVNLNDIIEEVETQSPDPLLYDVKNSRNAYYTRVMFNARMHGARSCSVGLPQYFM